MDDRHVQGPFDELPFAGVATGCVTYFLGQSNGQANVGAILGMPDSGKARSCSIRLPARLVLWVELERFADVVAKGASDEAVTVDGEVRELSGEGVRDGDGESRDTTDVVGLRSGLHRRCVGIP